MAAIDFPALNQAYLEAFGDQVDYQPQSAANFLAMAIESRAPHLEGLDATKPSYWFSLPADLANAKLGRDLQVRPQIGDLMVIGGVTYVLLNMHDDRVGGVYLTFEAQ